MFKRIFFYSFTFQTICINLHFVKQFIKNYNTSDSVVLDKKETEKLKDEINEAFQRQEGKHMYSHKVRDDNSLFVVTSKTLYIKTGHSALLL